ncbi:MAG: hypothetical protein M1838_003106 [Thelocarpon superellum]|nr:MAG: hypothetical protein M1838_003106 [Thelocarpon superellum]
MAPFLNGHTKHAPRATQTRKISQSTDLDTSNASHVRKYHGTYGLIPPNVESYETQATRCLRQLAQKRAPIEKYQYLSQLRNNNVHLFYRLVMNHMKELTPIIYTPVVGEACLSWSDIYQQPEGLYLSYSDRGSIRSILDNWPQSNVEITVVTDGSRILGLGDLGINGMGIPVGKLALYTGCAGIRPEATLPLMLDLGTNNKKLVNDPLYMGSRRERVTLADELVFQDELMAALTDKWPGIVIQFEDFKDPFPALAKYRDVYTCFNDDIQGTGAVVLAGIINAIKRTDVPLKDHRAVFMGAGSAGVGVAKQIVEYFMREGLSEDEARRRFWLVDTKGLVTLDRGDRLAEHKVYFARDDNRRQQHKTLAGVIDHVKPTILMGLSTIGGIFDEKILTTMGQLNKAPIVFPLSNPSKNAECTFEEALKHTEGRAIFASGSPFHPATYDGRVYSPGQGNNMYVFPGIGLGTILCKATVVKQEMIYASAVALSTALTPDEARAGLLYPDVSRIRNVSVLVARGVIRAAQTQGVDRELALRQMSDVELDQYIRERMYDPKDPTKLGDSVHGSRVGGTQESTPHL